MPGECFVNICVASRLQVISRVMDFLQSEVVQVVRLYIWYILVMQPPPHCMDLHLCKLPSTIRQYFFC